MTKRDKTTVDDIIGIVHTDEPTNSVEEVKKLRGRTNERFIVDTAGTLVDMVTRDTFDYVSDVVDLLNKISAVNEQLKIRLNEEKEKALKFCRNIDTLIIENEQLRQRNTNQYNQLTELWEIIEEENWKKLIAMKKQLKEDEERLQKEWGCYE